MSRVALAVLTLMFAFLVSATATGQASNDIPRPEELQAASDRAEPLRIDSPREGDTVQIPFTVTGMASPGARLELWVGSALDRVFMADANGRFTSAVARSSPGEKIWVHQIDGGGKRIQSVGVAVAWGGAANPLAAQPLRDTAPGRPTDDVDPSAPDSTPEALPTVNDLGSTSLGDTPPPPPSTDAFDPPAKPASAAEIPQLHDNAPPPVLRKRTPPRPVRALAEAGLGFGAGIVVGAAAGALGFGIGLASGDIFVAAILGSFGLFGGWLGGIPLGVVLGGKLMDGNGSVLATIGGEAIGLVASLALTAATPDGGGAVSVLVLPLAGAIAGYELTSDASASQAAAQKGLQSLRPTITRTREGKPAFGLSLRF
jgi:hypothetical protein